MTQDLNSEISFPVVGLGASAGGIKAFTEFFSGIPDNGPTPGMAFVLVQHLSPDHKSLLSELIRRSTKMPVFEVVDGMTLKKNCVYIIPPNADLSLNKYQFILSTPTASRGFRLPIDFFFRSLAQNFHHKAIGIILSGTGSDGTLGIREIKVAGGLVLAQTLDSCEFDGMPRNAMATGLVDFELVPSKMVDQIINYINHQTENTKTKFNQESLDSELDHDLKQIFILIQSHTGHDFSGYKISTIGRRIERRLNVHQISSISDYLKFLKETPAEVEALFQDLLIGVTSFFRDPFAFKVLEEKIIPTLFSHKPAIGGIVRVWSVACSTGEEAYSIAILIQEYMEKIKQIFKIQIFATDIDSHAIAFARTGVYPKSIALDISPERLARYFTAEIDGQNFRINKNIREMLIFSEQNVIKDPPFSKVDLVTCRNFLIYLNSHLQQKLIPLFHYALNPGGILFLGSSEGLGENENLFTVVDRKAKIYLKKEFVLGTKRAVVGQLQTLARSYDMASHRMNGPAIPPAKLHLRELTERALLAKISLNAALLNNNGDILYLHGNAGKYLEHPQGEVGVSNILKIAREGLKTGLAVTLQKAVTENDSASGKDFRVKLNESVIILDITITPLSRILNVKSEPSLYLLTLEEIEKKDLHESQEKTTGIGPEQSNNTEIRLSLLEQELKSKDEQLHNSYRDLESYASEIKSFNEELQSVNEELQSTNEELETSKEELQSVNEELATVNNELNVKVTDLSLLNNDMNNLLAGSGIATIFLDHKLRVLRFTPSAAYIINLIQSDSGRPIAHIVSNLVENESLIPDIQKVLDTLVPKESEVQSKAGRWYTMRIIPYRTLENVIEGVVLTFIDITEKKEASAIINQANQFNLFRDSVNVILIHNLEGKIIAWNKSAIKVYGWSEHEALQMNITSMIADEFQQTYLTRALELAESKKFEALALKRFTKLGTILSVNLIVTGLINDKNQIYAISTLEKMEAQT